VSEPVPQRVRITNPRVGAARTGTSRAIAREIAEQTDVGEVYLASLIRAQGRLALRICATAAVLIGGLPLVFELVPPSRTAHVLGIPLPWLVLGLLAYPVMIGLGWRAVVGAERNEAEFAELVQHD
jgi:hypothetical protein